MRVAASLAAALLGLAAPLAAQTTASTTAQPRPAVGGKKPITQDVYDIWRSIQGATLSNDGRWVAYSLTPAVGDGELVVRSTTSATEFRVPRGFLGRPVTRPGGAPGGGGGGGPLPAAEFSADSRWVVTLAYAPKAEFDRAARGRRGRGRGADQPKASLAIVSLPGGQVATVPRVKSFKLPEEGGRWLAYLLEAPDSADRDRDSTASPNEGRAAAAPGGQARPVAGDSTGPRRPRKETGSTLVLRDLSNGTEVRIADVTDYLFDEKGGWLGYTVSSKDSTRDGAYARDLAAGREVALLTGPGNYKQLVFDEAGTQLAFVSDRAEFGRDEARYALYHAPLERGRAELLVAADAFGPDTVVADRGDVSFVESGRALLFGVAPAPLDSIPADSLADKAVFDLWHYKDTRLQPQQQLEAGRDRNRSYQTIYHFQTKRVVRLADDTLRSVDVSDDGRVALGVTDAPYALESMWGEGGNDVYLVDARTGGRKVIARNISSRASLSPEAKYVLWFDRGHWYSHDVASGKQVDLTGGLEGVHFDQETWDTPSIPAAWGVGGWTKGDDRVLLYDRYDVWEVDPSGARAPRMLTDSVGRQRHVVFRVVNLASERGARGRGRFGGGDEEPLDPAQPLLLRAMNDETKASGFWEDRIGADQSPRQIVMGERSYGTPTKAEDADVFMLTQETVREFPDLWVGPSLTQLTKISNANPQQSEYRWADVELVRWRSLDGIELKGLLYKPEDFDPSKKYPMVTYFYEQLSDNLYNYVVPAGRNVVNPVVYASLGYLVFEPDIAYTEGYPGQSALHSVVPGIQSLVARGFVDPKAIGSAGQSWGGYQTAYMITQTNIFAAAMAGAPVANMTSAYGGIRWGSGLARAFQYEHTQSRIGGSIWEYPMRYIENSPLFFADRVETPLLIMHNDHDDAVPWYQGIELFVALKRFGKEVYLINYNDDVHNPRKRANQKDIDMRMQQFFGYHLKGEPMPDWMAHGIPFLQKGRDQIATEPEEIPTGTTAQPAQPAREPGSPTPAASRPPR
ncbi:MAG TPA: prolyl oligopeptidase family serine peptidase [Gemmatimonadaceae bacterium]|nr:prolyl oligopeptidase family serine peptidase [Gemmatimonadaceae bacterium]